ncbi:hypothetical protein HDU83_002926 [Entophlyctis luteolus]|nr:hypothetical protein HDU83_002926 [Entophlyctis luteolus]
MSAEVLRLHAQLRQLQHTEESLASAPLNLSPEAIDSGSGSLTNAEVEAWRQSAAVFDESVTSATHDGIALGQDESPSRMPSQRRATTVWDEDDVEQLRIAHALAKHASELFPNNIDLKQKELLAQSSLSKVIRRSTAESTVSTVNVKSLVGNWEQRQKSSALSPSRSDARTELPATRTSRRLSIKQNIMLKKTLHSFRNADTDAIKPEDFASMASKILNEGNDDNSDLASLGNPADQDEAFINAYFEELEGPASVTVVAVPSDLPFQKPPTPSNSQTQLPATKAAHHIHTDKVNSSKQPVDTRDSGFMVPITEEPPQTPVSDSSKPVVRNRRQTAQHLSAIRKRAVAMPASRLLKELDTVMSDIQQFGGVDLYSDDEVEAVGAESQDEWANESSGSHWYKASQRKSEENEPDSAISQYKPEHPPHLMKYRERASLYTASDMNQLDHEDLSVMDPEEEFLPDMSSFDNVPRLGLISPGGSTTDNTLGKLIPVPPSNVSEEKRAASALSTNTVESAASNKAQVVVRNETMRTGIAPAVEAVAENDDLNQRGALRAKSPSFFQRVFRSKSPTAGTTGSIRGLSAKNSVSLLPKPSKNRLVNQEEQSLSHTREVYSPPSISQTRTITSPSIHTRTVASPPHNIHSNAGSSSTLLSSEDDPDATSGELRLHTNKLFNPWQDVVLVLSPRRRGIYYVKTGKFSRGFAKSEQVVGFIELNSLSSVESIGSEDRGLSSTFKGKPTFRVVKVNELEGGAVKKEYFYFCSKAVEDRDMWVNSIQGFLNDLRQFEVIGLPNAHTSSIYTSRNSVRGGGSVPSLHSPEELSLQLLKQQKLLLQQRALMAAVAQQLHLQQEITAELQAAKISQHRLSVTNAELALNPQLISPTASMGTPATTTSRKRSTAVISIAPKTPGPERAVSRTASRDYFNVPQSGVSRKGSLRQEVKQFEGQIPLSNDILRSQSSNSKLNDQVSGANMMSRTLSDGGYQAYSHFAKRSTTPSSVSYNGRATVSSKSMRPASPPPEKKKFFGKFKSRK